MTRTFLALLFVGASHLGSASQVHAQTASVLAVDDTLPAWDWQPSRSLLTAPLGFCGPTIKPPGALVEAHLLAWRVLALSPAGGRSYLVLWWGRYVGPDSSTKWVLAHGYHHDPPFYDYDRAHPWSLGYVCDIPGRPYVLFDRPPRGADAQALGVSVLQGSRVVTTVEVAIRRKTWRALLLDEPPGQ